MGGLKRPPTEHSSSQNPLFWDTTRTGTELNMQIAQLQVSGGLIQGSIALRYFYAIRCLVAD